MPATVSMIKKQLTRSDYFIIAANLIPVYGVLFEGWSAKEVFLVYCLETIIVGIFNIIKMGIVTSIRKTDTWYNGPSRTQQHGLFFIFFFIVHYGLFVAVQMGIFFGVSGIAPDGGINVFSFFYRWPQLLGKDAYYMLAGFIISYGFSLIYNFILSGQYRTISLMHLMFQPYIRIFIQQFTVIAGSMFLSFGAGKVFIILFAGVKIFFEAFVDYDRILNRQMEDLKSGKMSDQS
jgi:Family of unknown function (DUF6498)